MRSILLTAFIWCLAAQLSFAQSTPAAPSSDSLKTASVKVKGITCSMDLKTIAGNVEKLSGVVSCKAGKQGPTTTFDIRYNPALTNEKQIFTAIENTGGCSDPDARPYKVKL